jgi:hypothetical protein
MAKHFHARIQLGDEHNEDKYRDVVVMGRQPGADSIALTVSSIGFNTWLTLTPEKARELGAALIAAADAPAGDEP